MNVTTRRTPLFVTKMILLLIIVFTGAVGIGLSLWARAPLDMGRLAVSSSFNAVGIPLFLLAVGTFLVVLVASTKSR